MTINVYTRILNLFGNISVCNCMVVIVISGKSASQEYCVLVVLLNNL